MTDDSMQDCGYPGPERFRPMPQERFLEITTDEMIDELARRFQNLLVVAATQRSAGLDNLLCEFRGGIIPALGFCDYARDFLKRDLHKQNKEMNDAE